MNYPSGFSLSFKVDSYDVKVGGLVIECCASAVGMLRLSPGLSLTSLYPLFPKTRWVEFNIPVACVLAGWQHLMRTLPRQSYNI